jgi:toxin ParE1/3/4
LDWKAELRPSALRDLRALFVFLAETHKRNFGHDAVSATRLAAERLTRIQENLTRLENAPGIGSTFRHGDRVYRHVTIERATYWFTLDDDRGVIQIEAIFHQGQNHLQHMLSRLTGKAP